MFPATLPLLFTVIFVAFHLYFEFKHGARAIIIGFSLTSFLILLNFGIHLSTGEVFH
jgi:hypothetical protein